MTPIRVGNDIFVFGGGGDMMTQDKHTEIWRVSSIWGYTQLEISKLNFNE